MHKLLVDYIQVSRKKQYRYDELGKLPNVLEISEEQLINSPKKISEAKLKLKSITQNFKRVVLEVGCGSGEYTRGLAELDPLTLFIGIDLKGDRLWAGAKKVAEMGLNNVFFIRVDLLLISHIFEANSVTEIWITFPDPQPTNPKRRLTGQNMLSKYLRIIQPDGKIFLKTDNDFIFQDFVTLTKELKFTINYTEDLYNSNRFPEFTRQIKTHYEKKYLAQGQTIKLVEVQS
ncbi:MAG: tRNA (guanosine(46)-N7)-methyltransferase TrmB [Patescibacteria group bacterium]